MILSETSNETNVTEHLLHLSCFLGSRRVTNNEAEYHGMLLALDEALKQVRAFAERHPPSSCHVDIQINGDSDLIIQQMLGNYQVRSENLVPLHRQANTLVASIQQIMDTQVRYQHVYRDNNAVADGECVILVRTTPSRIPP
jgi:ribonuclease HI